MTAFITKYFLRGDLQKFMFTYWLKGLFEGLGYLTAIALIVGVIWLIKKKYKV